MPLTLNGTTGIVTENLADGSVTTADIANGAVTAAKLDTSVLPIGVSQTWQNVSSNRAIPASQGAFYTNTTGRPIFVNIRFQANPPVLVSLEIGSIGVVDWAQSGGESVRQVVSAVIPAGDTYRAWATFGVLVEWAWFELR